MHYYDTVPAFACPAIDVFCEHWQGKYMIAFSGYVEILHCLFECRVI